MKLSFVFWNKVLKYSPFRKEKCIPCYVIVESYLIRSDFTDLGIKNIIVATSSSILFFPHILVFFPDYSCFF